MEIGLFASLREGRSNTANVQWVEGMDGYALLSALDIAAEDVAIFLVNGNRKELNTKLNNNDIVALFPPIGGG